LPSLPEVMCDRDGLKQVFINLIKNAIEALAGRGNIYIETSFLPENTAMPGGSVKIIVSDDGPGIPPHVESHIFEPYTSTKGNGHSGIGLSIVYNIIKELGGTVTCSSLAGKGCTFNIILPAYTTL